MIVLKTEREVSYMRDAGKIVGQTFLELKKAIELNKDYNKDIINSSSFKPM